MSISKVQHQALEDGFFDLLGNDKSNFEPVKFTDIASSVVQLGGIYAATIREYLDKADAASSGKLAGSVQPTELEYDGKTYKIGVQANSYLNYVDKGVNGWFKSRGSVYSFKTKGVDPNGEMVKSVKAYLQREGNSARNVKVAISSRESKGMSANDRNAITAAFMIKRQGIEPKKFMEKANADMISLVEKELGEALKIDIINNF